MGAVSLSKVAIVGGTHGNELTGAYLIQKFERDRNLIERSSFQTLTLLANPRALAANKRYIDRDLNRCFTQQDLANPYLKTYEDLRAKEIWGILSNSDTAVDLIIDCHSTTANMGLTLILGSEHPFLLRLAAHICALEPKVKVYRWNNYSSLAQDPFLRSLAPLGLTIEVGAIAHGVFDRQLCAATEKLIYDFLDYVEAHNCEAYPQDNRSNSIQPSLTIYQNIQLVDFPRNNTGAIIAQIHPDLVGKDFTLLQPGEAIFQTFAGEDISYQGHPLYPVFIGESSYQEKGIAMCLSEKREIFLEKDLR